MDYQNARNEIKTIRQGESGFMLTDGIAQYPRAYLEIDEGCPFAMRNAIESAYTLGYLKMIAHVPGKQLTWERLTND